MEQAEAEPSPSESVLAPLDIIPPDDTGSDVYARFRYQARVAVPYCLACALGDSVRSVVLEHIEDILIENHDGIWRFMQVKTRDASYGHWRLSDLTGASGAMHSLLRAHRAIGDQVQARLEAHLEGTCSPTDSLLQELLNVGGSRSGDLCRTVGERLGLDDAESRQFLGRVSVHEEPRREAIEQRNLALIVARRGGLTDMTIVALHERLTDDIGRAMEAALPGDDWIRAAIGLITADDESQRRLEVKRLTPERLAFYSSLLNKVILPLIGSTDDQGPADLVSDLERKLRLAGASEALVSQAKTLRSSASHHELSLLSRTLNPVDRRLEDVQQRLRTIAIPVADMLRGQRQAAQVFHTILAELRRDPRSVDPHGLFNADGVMLMGALCQLSAECQTDWG